MLTTPNEMKSPCLPTRAENGRGMRARVAAPAGMNNAAGIQRLWLGNALLRLPMEAFGSFFDR